MLLLHVLKLYVTGNCSSPSSDDACKQLLLKHVLRLLLPHQCPSITSYDACRYLLQLHVLELQISHICPGTSGYDTYTLLLFLYVQWLLESQLHQDKPDIIHRLQQLGIRRRSFRQIYLSCFSWYFINYSKRRICMSDRLECYQHFIAWLLCAG